LKATACGFWLFHCHALTNALHSTVAAMKKPFCFRRMAFKNFSRDESLRTSARVLLSVITKLNKYKGFEPGIYTHY
jgi:phage gp16-like protein